MNHESHAIALREPEITGRHDRQSDLNSRQALEHIARRPQSYADHRLSIAAIASVLLHGALVAGVTLELRTHVGVAGGQQLDTISVDLIDSRALESITSSMTSDGGASSHLQASAGSEGADYRTDTVPDAPPPRERSFEDTSSHRDEDHGLSAPPELSEPVTVAQLPEERKRDKETVDNPEDAPEAGTREQSPAQLSNFGASAATSHAETPSSTLDSGASAPSGIAGCYAVSVRLALGKSRPTHRGRTGRVYIEFGLDRAGRLRLAQINRSSGDPDMDRAAILAVRSTRFPTPPADLTEVEMTYVVPFDFR